MRCSRGRNACNRVCWTAAALRLTRSLVFCVQTGTVPPVPACARSRRRSDRQSGIPTFLHCWEIQLQQQQTGRWLAVLLMRTCSVLCKALASACMPAVAISTPGALQEVSGQHPFAPCDGCKQVMLNQLRPHATSMSSGCHSHCYQLRALPREDAVACRQARTGCNNAVVTARNCHRRAADAVWQR